MSSTVLVLIGLSLGTYALKAAGPLFLGVRPLPKSFGRLADLLPPALLASLVVVNAVGSGAQLVLDARVVGVTAAGLALWKRAPFVVAVAAAVAATAAVRVLS